MKNGGKRIMTRRTFLLLVLALLVAAITGFGIYGSYRIRKEYGQGMEKFLAGEYSAAAEILERPAVKKYKDAPDLLQACRILETADQPTENNIYRLKDYLSVYRPEAAEAAARNRLTELGHEAWEKGMSYYRQEAYGNAKDPLELAAAAGIPDAGVYCDLSRAMAVTRFYHDFEAAENYVGQAEKAARSPELQEECRRIRERVQEARVTWETTELVIIRNSDPYNMMLEKDLPETLIGQRYRAEKETKEVKAYKRTNIYTTYRYYSGEKEVFRVKCMNGMVYEVEDLRGTGQAESKSGQKSGAAGKSTTDPYNAKDYAHPEDFYDWYADDFWDYEDAEDYWEEHH